MNIIDTMEKKELVELLGKCWITHDGVWFMNCAAELGMAATNRLNKAAIRSLAPIEVGRYRSVMGLGREPLNDYEQVQRFFQGARELVIPDFMGAQIVFPGGKEVRWHFSERRCFAWRGMQRMGVIHQYECGVIYRIRCWLDALGLAYDMAPMVDGGCIDPEGGACSGVFHLHLESSSKR